MNKVVITSYARTPIGAFLGSLKEVPVEELAAIAVKNAVMRSNLENHDIDGVVMGHVISSADVGNLGRWVALKSGLGEKTIGFTVNRICGSGIQSVISAAQEIWMGNADTMVAGGAESLSRVPYYLPLSVRYKGLLNKNYTLLCSNEEYAKHSQPEEIYGPVSSMGETAENIVVLKNIPREMQDEFAYNSHMKAARASNNGRFSEEIVPVTITTKNGTIEVSKDEHIRLDTSLEKLSKLRPVFKSSGTVTAGNASGLNDAAAAVVLMSEEKCKERGLVPMGYVVDYAIAGIDPRVMGLGPVPAIQKLLKKNNLTLDDIGILEINEAFAAQVLGCLMELGNMPGTRLYNNLNINGGAVALGHPLGMSGTRLVGAVCCEFKHNESKYGIASACIGGGMGIALLIQRP